MTLPQRLFSLLLGSLATLPVLAQDAGPQPAEGLSADPPKVDFGVAFEGETLTQDVVITNQGGEDWPVARIQTSCGCTVAKLFGPGDVELSTRPKGSDPIVVLSPGESVKTVVEFKTAGKHGKVSQEMTLHSTDDPAANTATRSAARKSVDAITHPALIHVPLHGPFPSIAWSLWTAGRISTRPNRSMSSQLLRSSKNSSPTCL